MNPDRHPDHGAAVPVIVTDSPELLVVMPAYNEEASISRVVRECHAELVKNVGNFALLVIDDGSTDQTAQRLASLSEELDDRFLWYTHQNRGHGQTCLEGYRVAMKQRIPFVHQVDSDGQCDPGYFASFWQQRGHHDVIYGRRKRDDGFRRVIASAVLRGLLRVAAGVSCEDPNVPYRLMRTEVCAQSVDDIPEDFFLANVGLSVALKRRSEVRHGVVPIRFRERYGGEPKVPFSKFLVKAVELLGQLGRLKGTS